MNLNINPAVILGTAFAILFPILLIAVHKKKTGAKLWCYLAGFFCFALFAVVLESYAWTFLGNLEGPVSSFLSSVAGYVVFSCLAAGIFEETGRLFGFLFLLARRTGKRSAVAYGIGHGCCEIILLLGLSYGTSLAASLGVPMGDETLQQQLAETAMSFGVTTTLTAIAERLFAMMIHVGLSMVVFASCKQKHAFGYFFLAVFLHAIADLPAALYQFGLFGSITAIELFVFVMGVVCMVIGTVLMKKYDEKNREIDDEDLE